MNPLVSVIVPVYNVEPFIERCARSLFAQTLTDLEILFVDDCSPDKSSDIILRILEEYPVRKSHVRTIKMSANGGLAAVRRQGIIEATGDYVIHCDGDDWVDIDLYKTMYEKAIADNADIVVCNEAYEYIDKSELHIIDPLPQYCKDVVKLWYKRPLGMFCHNKLIKRSLYVDNGILPWVGLNMWEDNGLLTRLFYYGKKLSQIHGPVYHYNRANAGAMTASYGEKQVMQMIGIVEHLTEFFNSLPDRKEFEKTTKAFQFLAKINLITDNFKNLKKYKTVFPGSEEITKDLSDTAFSFKGKVRFYFVKWNLSIIFILLFKALKILDRTKYP